MARTLRPKHLLRRPSAVICVTQSKGKGKGRKQKQRKNLTGWPRIRRHARLMDRAYIKKSAIPKALREQVWLTHVGPVFAHKCFVTWCNNNISVFNFHVGHDIAESRGGATEISNLRPICPQCNLSMGNRYTIQAWSKLSKLPEPDSVTTRSWGDFFRHCWPLNRDRDRDAC